MWGVWMIICKTVVERRREFTLQLLSLHKAPAICDRVIFCFYPICFRYSQVHYNEICKEMVPQSLYKLGQLSS